MQPQHNHIIVYYGNFPWLVRKRDNQTWHINECKNRLGVLAGAQYESKKNVSILLRFPIICGKCPTKKARK